MSGEFVVLCGVCKVEQDFVYLCETSADVCYFARCVGTKKRFKVVFCGEEVGIDFVDFEFCGHFVGNICVEADRDVV